MEHVILSGKNFSLQATTGKVLSTDKNLETKVSGSGGGGFITRGSGYNRPVRVTSTTTVHDQIFIEDKNGKEHSFQLSGYNVACRENNILSVLAAFKENQNDGTYFAVINHSTDKIYYKDAALKAICGPNTYLLVGIGLITSFLGFEFTEGKFFIQMILIIICLLIYYVAVRNKNINLLKNAIRPSDYLPSAN